MARWLPLESNPSVLNKYLKNMGMNEEFSLTDVYGIEEELLAMVPQPAAAIILLFPLTENEEKFKKQEEDKIKAAGVTTTPKDVYFMKQYVGNACGTVALIHAVSNNLGLIKLDDGPLKSFLDKTKDFSPEDKGHALENDDGIAGVHDNLAKEGQTAAPDRDAKLDTHFISLVNVNNHLYELDGRKEFPIDHGATSASSFLSDAARVCGAFMKRDPSESRFAMVALAKSE